MMEGSVQPLSSEMKGAHEANLKLGATHCCLPC